MGKKKSWGGKRKGAGRKSKEPTKILSYRVPLLLSEKINTEIKELIEKIKASTSLNDSFRTSMIA